MLISVVTVSRNAALTIEATCRSIDEQSDVDIEHVVIDGQSTDGTLDVLAQNEKPYRHVFSGPDSGLYDAMNKGLARSNGEIVVFLNADDRYAGTQVLASIHRSFVETQADVVHANIDMIVPGRESRVQRRWKSGRYARWKLAFGWQIPHPALFVRRNLLNEIGGFDSSYRIAADYDLILRLVNKPGVRLTYLRMTAVEMAVGGVSTSGLKASWHGYLESARVLSQHVGAAGYVVAFVKPLGKLPQWFSGRFARSNRSSEDGKDARRKI